VGTGSIRGMAALSRLSEAGFSIWPFDVPTFPLVIEIYPRLLTGRVNKSSADSRRAYLDRWPDIPDRYRDAAATSEDAFDAVVSAMVMAGSISELGNLQQSSDPAELLEGRIWYP